MVPFILMSFLLLALVPGGQALALRRDSCGHNCRTDFGWPGCPFPSNSWGPVIDPKLRSATSSAAAVPTGSALPYSAGDVEATPSSHPGIKFTGYSTFPYSPRPTSTPTPSLPSNSSTGAPSSSTSKNSSTSLSLHASSTPQRTPPTSSTSPSPPPPSSSPPSTSSPSPSPSPSPSSSPSPSPSPSSSPVSSGSAAAGSTSGPTSQSDIQAYLEGHNSIRSQHGAAPLTYSQDLAAKAQKWANGCVFQHSGGQLGPFGENLAAGTGSGYGIPQAIQSWTDEASQYDPGNPQPSHFTQVVWKSTTQVGCALQDCDGIFPSNFGQAHFYVCEYSPAGNVLGEFSANVQA